MQELKAAAKVGVCYSENKMQSYNLQQMKDNLIKKGREMKRLRELVKQI
jgi:hypothetical protein